MGFFGFGLFVWGILFGFLVFFVFGFFCGVLVLGFFLFWFFGGVFLLVFFLFFFYFFKEISSAQIGGLEFLSNSS